MYRIIEQKTPTEQQVSRCFLETVLETIQVNLSRIVPIEFYVNGFKSTFMAIYIDVSLFPFNSCRWLSRDVVDDTVNV